MGDNSYEHESYGDSDSSERDIDDADGIEEEDLDGEERDEVRTRLTMAWTQFLSSHSWLLDGICSAN